MRAGKIVLIVLFGTICAYAQQNQFQPYPYTVPNYANQNGVPYYEPAPQQQIPYYSQYAQQPLYYPVNQPLQQQQQPVIYPPNGQGSYYPYPYLYGGLNQQQLQQQQASLQYIQPTGGKFQQQPVTELQLQPIEYQKNNTVNQTKPLNITPDPYGNVVTEIIDVNPADFRKILQQMHAQPTIVSYENRIVRTRSRHPHHFEVRTESKQTNQTSIPNNIEQHKAISKTYSFNKTIVLHPGEEKNSVINLNFVNGVQVTEPPKADDEDEKGETTTSTTSFPQKDPKRFIDVPTGCEEGSQYSVTGGCFSPFSHHLNTTENTSTKSPLQPKNFNKAPTRNH